MNNIDLKTILEKHKMWLNDEDGGEMADLRRADLRRGQPALGTTHRICTKSILPTDVPRER